MKYTVSLQLFMICAILIACKKTPEDPSGGSMVALDNTTVDSIKATWAVVSSDITSIGTAPITDHGFCWGTNPLPDLSSSFSSQGAVTEPREFSYYLSGLTNQTTYYIRSYARTTQVIYYSDQQEFTTLELLFPAVSTSPVTHVTSSSVRGGGVITSDGNGIISARGVCWNTVGDPTLANALGSTSDGSGTGSFASEVSGLSQQTTYFIAAYVTNEKGTAYGAIKSFTTPLPCGQLTIVYENQTYNSVKIGTQCWFKENLNVGSRIDGSQNQDPANPTVEKYCFNNDEANCDTYGGLYQWDELMKNSTTEGAQGICPAGWHIPTDEEWITLTNFLGGESVAGTKLKSATGWLDNGNGTNVSGFTGLPNGNRGNDGNFNDLTKLSYFWSSSQSGASEAWNRKLHFDTETVTSYNSFKTNGFAVRCLQDN